MNQTNQPTSGQGTGLDRYRHVCVLYHSADEEFEVCTYDLARFSASSVIDVLRSHPVATIGGIVHENPFYMPPDELLRELETSRGAPSCRHPAAPVA
jgi:hypothetical protein